MSGTSLTTASGRVVDLVNPTPADIDFGDVCEHLAKENRYNGATPETCYSVAEHLSRGALVIYSDMHGLGQADLAAAWFLVHDMPEAYLKDDTTPKKRAIAAVASQEFGVLAGAILAAFDSLTLRFERAITAAAGLSWPPPDDVAELVHRYDKIMLNTEWRDLMRGPHPWPINPGEEPLANTTIRPWGWQRAVTQLRKDCRQWLPACRKFGGG
jgi:5'-deoxynucleotidase YfbR-like HD superfamily hydrolase